MSELNLDQNEKFNTLEALFGADLDDIADLPAFEVPPPGAYLLRVSTEIKKINNKPVVEFKYEVVETVALKVQDESAANYRAPSKPGTQFSVPVFIGGDDKEKAAKSVARLKAMLLPFGQHFGNTKVEPLINELIKDVTIAAVITNREDKQDPEKIYAGVRDVAVA